ncbi:MAG: baseplate protein J [Chloroflexales bacterium]|nr:baseplate protein J [Chloroflexales bacterium]
MTLPLPKLDDRTYGDLLDEARAEIARVYPAWTDHNPSDPGITVLELLVWVCEQVMFQADQIPEASYDAFLSLLQGPGYRRSEPLADAIRTTVLGLRERYRAVTAEDFEHLALGAWAQSGPAATLGAEARLARARCIPGVRPVGDNLEEREGHLALVIVPVASGSTPPTPTEGLRTALWEWLDQRRLLGTRHHVIGPRYVPVEVRATLALRRDALADDVRLRVARALVRAFDPLGGGPDGRGWPFGRPVYRSEIFQVVDRVEGVNYIVDSGDDALRLISSAPELRADDGGLVGARLAAHELPAFTVSPEHFKILDQNTRGR